MCPGADSQRRDRAIMIIMFASTGFVPPLHKGLQGFAVMEDAAMILLDLLALFFYLTHIPERWWPHTFDLWVSDCLTFPLISG